MVEENQTPNFMVNSIDFKKTVINYFFQMVNAIKNGEIEGVTFGEKNTVRILTNFGLIEGKVINFDEEGMEQITAEKDFASIFYSAAIKGADMSMAKYEDEIGSDKLKVVNQTGRLVLADAVVSPYANPQNKFSISRLLVFTDQIVGITFGEEPQQ